MTVIITFGHIDTGRTGYQSGKGKTEWGIEFSTYSFAFRGYFVEFKFK
jgi:hypothetical protein